MTSAIRPEDEVLIANAQAELRDALAEGIPDYMAESIAKKVKALIFVIVTLMTSACVGPAPAPVSSACAWVKIIHPSRQDTIETLRQIDEHNQSVRANCPVAA